MMKLSPSTAAVPATQKAAEHAALLRDHWQRRHEDDLLRTMLADIDDYDTLLNVHRGMPLRRARVFEIGYGARPYRFMALRAMGVDAWGIDAEVPVMHGTPRELAAAFRANGVERVAKSLVRHVLFDRRERARLAALLGRPLPDLRRERARLAVGDATDHEPSGRPFDLVFAEDVFEHIPGEALPALVSRMASWLHPDGLALIRPNVFTGITGGHLVEWNVRSLSSPPAFRKTRPWEHLRADVRCEANSYVNRLTRADYRKLFGLHFDILEERVKYPELGRGHMTPELRAELREWSDEELFSNQVLFVLRPRGG